MANYNALTKMKEINSARYGIDGPQIPPNPFDEVILGVIEKKALEFVRVSCEDLRFDKTELKYWNLGDLEGKSVGPNQIPLFMERDIDRLCLENAIHRFLLSNSQTDAFDVYFCFLEMFMDEIAPLREKMQLLAEYEHNARGFVNDFLAGLGKYESNIEFQTSYQKEHDLCDKKDAAHHYLEHWGRSSLFPSAEKKECEKSLSTVEELYSFERLYDFAIALNAMYNARNYDTKEWIGMKPAEMVEAFDKLSLEYKLSNFAQAKAFVNYLNEIGCFCSNKELPNDRKLTFTVEELQKIGIMEHARWDAEKIGMGWQYGSQFVQKAKESNLDRKLLREQTRTHNDIGIPFDMLSKTEQNKDTDPMNDMIKLVELYGGIKIYQS